MRLEGPAGKGKRAWHRRGLSEHSLRLDVPEQRDHLAELVDVVVPGDQWAEAYSRNQDGNAVVHRERWRRAEEPSIPPTSHRTSPRLLPPSSFLFSVCSLPPLAQASPSSSANTTPTAHRSTAGP